METSVQESRDEGKDNPNAMWSQDEREELRRIASRHSTTTRGNDPSVLDPTSSQFDLSTWMLHQVHQFEGDHTARRTGIALKNVTVQGSGSEIQIQHTVSSSHLSPITEGAFRRGNQHAKTILDDFHGYVNQGEMLLVLGRPGAGCSTLLKTIAGETYGLDLSEDSVISYDGIPQSMMKKNFKGEILYNQEVEKREMPHHRSRTELIPQQTFPT